jgi:hypothetical protein
MRETLLCHHNTNRTDQQQYFKGQHRCPVNIPVHGIKTKGLNMRRKITTTF